MELKKLIVPAWIIVVGSLGWYIGGKLSPSPKTEIQVVHDTKEIRVEVPVLTEKVVDRIITDPKQQIVINQLMKENCDLETHVAALLSTVATNTSSGGGTPIQISEGTLPPGEVVHSDNGRTPDFRRTYEFKDFQLDATYDSEGKDFNYRLNQTFRIATTLGKDPDGHPVSLVRLFQDTPTGQREVPSNTTAIHANPAPTRWRVSPRIQGGVGVDQDNARGGIVAFQWLKRGKSLDPKDLRLGALSPGVFVTSGQVRPVLLPITFNLGSLPKQPFSNVWAGFGVGLDKRLMVTLTSTF
jgi:hypothetical protein